MEELAGVDCLQPCWYVSELVLVSDWWISVLFKLGLRLAPRGGINNVTNRSSDNGFNKAKPRIRSGGMTPLGTVSGVAEATRSSTKGFNLRFVSYVAFAPQSSFSVWESTTCIAYDSVYCCSFNPKQAVGNRRGSASSKEFCFAFLWNVFVSFDDLFGKL